MELLSGQNSELLVNLFQKAAEELNAEEWRYRNARALSGPDYNLYLFDSDNERGLKLEDRGTGKLAIEFMFGPRRAAAFAQDLKEVWLIHTGTVHRNQKKPYSERTASIAGRSVFLVTNMDSPSIVSDLIRFHESRSASSTLPRLAFAIDAGAFKGGTRAAVVFEAHHAPVVNVLAKLVASGGWEPVGRAGSGNPDLVVERDGRKVLFEVKSGCDVHSLICAVGQCKVYDLEYETNRQIIVALSGDDILDGVDLWISEALDRLGIELVLASRRGEEDFGFRFQPRDELITRGK